MKGESYRANVPVVSSLGMETKGEAMANEAKPSTERELPGPGGKELEEARQLEQTKPSDWVAVEGQEADELWSAVESAKEAIRRRSGRPRSPEPLEAVHMKWPESLLTTVKDEAAKLSIGYQSFIRMAVSEYIRQRRSGKV
jgi:hypothetical protein